MRISMSNCEVVYAPRAEAPRVFSTTWVDNMTVSDLVQMSGFAQHYPEVTDLAVGIFAHCVAWDTLVKAGDRVELYRPLLLDPKEKRRRRAKE